jgi:hypothetical protein
MRKTFLSGPTCALAILLVGASTGLAQTSYTISTVAGNGSSGYGGDGGVGTAAEIGVVYDIAVDSAGAMYIADGWRVRKVSPGGVISTYAGTGNCYPPAASGVLASAANLCAIALALDAAGNLYVAESSNSHRVLKISPSGLLTLVAGVGAAGYSGDGGAATLAKLNYPAGLAADSNGNLYIADSYNNVVRKVSSGGIISTVAGTGSGGYSGDGGKATEAQLRQPSGVALDTAGNLYITDTLNSMIRKVTPGGIISTVAGGTQYSYIFLWPEGADVDSSGNIFIADTRRDRVQLTTPAGVTGIIAGTSVSGFSGDNGLATNARVNQPKKVKVAADGSIYVADTNNFRVRKLTPVSAGTPSRFVPVTPCRVVDTRAGQGTSGAFGPPAMPGGATRDFPIAGGGCPVPATALAYALNVTVVPSRPLGYLSIWPTGRTQPVVSTLNSPGGGIVANAAIVPAGTNGAISVYVTDATEVIVDINGYFAPLGAANSLPFFTLAPCRVVDTRAGQGTSGAFGPPTMSGGAGRDFPLPSGACSVPGAATAYSMNATVVPQHALSYLTLWPTGVNQPFVSTLNAPSGGIVANAAIVPAGNNGSVSAFATDSTDLILDLNGYFASSTSGLSLYPVTPCRVADTRLSPAGTFGQPIMSAGSTRDFPVPAVAACGVPLTARAYAVNVTVVPQGMLGYLTAWPTGQSRPLVSTLNAPNGGIVANAAIVPAGSNGSISVYVTNTTEVIIDINGYFAP